MTARMRKPVGLLRSCCAVGLLLAAAGELAVAQEAAGEAGQSEVQAPAIAVSGEAALGRESLGHGRHAVADERADIRPLPGPLAGVHAGAQRPLDDSAFRGVH